MSITKEQVADLQPGDVVELVATDIAEAPTTVRGRLTAYRDHGSLGLTLGAGLALRRANGEPSGFWAEGEWRLTVVSRAPRPLYVNHPRTEPVPGDVFRDADDPDAVITWGYCVDAAGNHAWRTTGGVVWILDNEREKLPDRLRLLVDGETGQVVP